MHTQILQWNLNGFYNNFDELKLLITKYNPLVIALQETHSKGNNQLKCRNYEIYESISTDNENQARGGSA